MNLEKFGKAVIVGSYIEMLLLIGMMILTIGCSLILGILILFDNISPEARSEGERLLALSPIAFAAMLMLFYRVRRRHKALSK